jgi:hypothetical protein
MRFDLGPGVKKSRMFAIFSGLGLVKPQAANRSDDRTREHFEGNPKRPRYFKGI